MAIENLPLGKAINLGLRQAMLNDPKVILMGEDIGTLGGVFRVTEGLKTEFGADRVLDTPLAVSGIVGSAIGLAMSFWKRKSRLVRMPTSLPLALKWQAGCTSAMRACRAVRLSSASASNCAVVRAEVPARQAARKRRPQAHCCGSSRRRSENGDVRDSSSLGSWAQIDGSASGCT